MFLARKINLAKWNPQSTVEEGEIAADAVTVDLRTTGNTLSFWRCDGVDDMRLKEVVLALAAGSDRIDKFDIAWLPEQEATSQGLRVVDTDGNTPVARLVNRHADIERLDLVRLSKVARLIQSAVSEGHFRRLTRAEVQQVLITAVDAGDLSPGAVNDKLRPGLLETLEKYRTKK